MSSSRQLIISFLIVAAITFLTFSPALNNGFTNWDDNKYVTMNADIENLTPQSVLNIFTKTKIGYHHYHPLTTLSFALERHFFGLNPKVFIFNNIILHIVNSCLVLILCLNLGLNRLASLFVALLFGIHPMHVESVVWIAQRKDVLYGLFYLLGLIVYARNRGQTPITSVFYNFFKKPGVIGVCPLFLSPFFFLCALCSKPAAVSFPLVLLVIDFYRGRLKDTSLKLLIAEKWLYFLLSAVFGFIAINQKASFDLPYTFFDRILFGSYSFLALLGKLIVPINLSAFYPFPEKVDGLYPPIFYFAPALMGFILYLGLRLLNQNRVVLFGILFFIASIFLSLGFIPVGNFITADRYIYIPSIGIFYLFGCGFAYWTSEESKVSDNFKKYFKSLIALFIVLLCIVTFQRTQVWRNGFTLWQDVLSKYPKVAIGHNYLGFFYARHQQIDLAMNHYNEAIRLNPQTAGFYVNRGNLYAFLGQKSKAVMDFDQALKLEPNNPMALKHRGMVLGKKGNRL